MKDLDLLFEENKSKFKGDIIYDGIVDRNQYTKSKLKVLWVLKEANSPDDSDWDMRDALYDLKNETGKGLKLGWANTFTPIVYTTYGLFNNLEWDKIPSLYNEPEVIDILQKIAYINVKKVPGNSVANYNDIKAYYDNNKEATIEQIKLINPQVIIFGNTLSFFDNDFFEIFGNLDENTDSNSLYTYSNKDYILLYAYHPNNRNLTQEEYCNSIINAVKQWKIKYNKNI